jgi:thiol-disulfide isomerase/thioredoxin
MAAMESTMLALGTGLPSFSLPDAVGGAKLTDRDVAGPRGTLIMFICNHCPFVKHVLPELDRIAGDYGAQGIGVVAINSNDLETYPQDGPVPMRELARERGWAFPFLFDADQRVAKELHAACTPDFFAFDAQRRLAYRGRLDDSRPESGTPLTGRDLRAALDAILAGRQPSSDQKPSMGCGIKWTTVNMPQ